MLVRVERNEKSRPLPVTAENAAATLEDSLKFPGEGKPRL